MDGLGTDPQLTAEFVKFLNAQLQTCRDQSDKLSKENAELRERLEQAPELDATVEGASRLAKKIVELKAELVNAYDSAERSRNEAAIWRERYEKSQKVPCTIDDLGDLQRKAAVEKVKRYMKDEFHQYVYGPSDKSSPEATTKYEEFIAFMTELSGSTTTNARDTESNVVFDTPKLQILPKAAIAASDGGFASFGPLLQLCKSPSPNAFLIYPTHHYTPHTGLVTESTTLSWTTFTQWNELAGQRREVLHTEDGHLVYIGTFLFHDGPAVLRLPDLSSLLSEDTLQELARRTFDPASKAQRTKARAYLQALRELYEEGETVTIRVLGLQRVGFNEKFFGILRKGYARRSKAVARARSVTRRSESPLSVGLFEREDEPAIKREREEEGGDSPRAGPSKVPKLSPGFDEVDGWDLF
ncbi:hypothetical protein C8Q77DRAFT_452663 [Trametes polyzona]|nr:hypothetical protein C8Q77DRAFT_452663 [Trametes polyzona]